MRQGREKELTEVTDVQEAGLRRLGCTKVFTWRFIDWRLHEDAKADHRCGRFRPVRYPTRIPFSELARHAEEPAVSAASFCSALPPMPLRDVSTPRGTYESWGALVSLSLLSCEG